MAGLIPFGRRNSNALSTGFTDFDNMLNDFFEEGWPFGKGLLSNTFRLDVQEKDNEYLVEAELPGVKKGDVSIDYDDGKLRISVNQNEEVEDKKKNYIHRERRCSSMCRSVYLDNAKGEGITAKLDNGILSITVPKTDRPDTSRQIPID